ncbi:hypothetical protein ACH5RR_014919 [Cinchona calisaya]|uniref:Uncharacterized protein n=1 Tax=Cinchona calisaya TaxID=153742 RepID=A0ABD2ZUR8_9GENT
MDLPWKFQSCIRKNLRHVSNPRRVLDDIDKSRDTRIDFGGSQTGSSTGNSSLVSGKISGTLVILDAYWTTLTKVVQKASDRCKTLPLLCPTARTRDELLCD